MLISIHDKTLRRVGFIDNEKPETLHYYNDTWHRYLTEATSTFDFSVPKSGQALLAYLNEKNYVSFRYEKQDYLFNIMRTEETETELTCYCENLSMELLNEISPAFKSEGAKTFEWYFNNSDLVGGQNFSDLVLGINEVSDYSRSVEWEGTDTKLARLLSLVNKFDAECEFVTELNRDGTLKRIVLNVYKANDEEYQGVGTRRQNVTLYYGKAIDGIRRTVDKTELYSAIYPLGKDGLNISSLDKTEYDADGNVLYYTHAGQPFIYAPQTADDYPAQVSTNDDPWILYRWSYETDNVNTLYGQALARLKKISQPAVTYEIEGAFELNIGDTVTIHDDKFTPTLLLEARVSEQEVSFCDPTKNKNIFSNFKALENRLSTDISGRLEELIQNAKPYLLEILSDNGIVFKNSTGITTLTARVMRGGMDVTDQLAFQWTEQGVNIATQPSLTVTADQVPEKTVFRAAAKGTDGSELCFAEVTLINVLDGEDGIGIDRVDLEYCQTTSPVTAPEGPWTENVPAWIEGKHIWQRTVVWYSDGTKKTTKPVCITGDKGAAGVSATEIMEEYYLSTSDKILLGGAWSETCPAWEKGKYIWTRSRCSWSDGTTTYTTPVFAGGLNSANDKADAAMGAVDAVEIKVNRLEAENVTIYGKLTASEAEIKNLEAHNVTISGKLDAAQGSIETLTAGQVTITGKLTSAEANIEKLTIGQTTITEKLTAAEADIVKLKADIAEVGDLTVVRADIGKLKADVADIDTALIGKADIDLANIKNGCITTAMIGTGVIGTTQIADGSITDAKIVGLTANKITAGQLDAAQIEVVNLNAANITVGTINGVQIAPGAITVDKLAQQVNDQITGAASAAQQAQTTADGKNKIYYQSTQPGLTGNKKGDTWFDTANGYRAYVWNGTAWSLSPFGSAAIADDAVTLAKVGADLQSFMDGINSKAMAAQTSADGKNTVFYQTTQPPTTGRKTGDTWFDTDDGNRINRWDGSKWTAAQFGTNAIANAAITNALIADATIQSAKIAALDAGKITTGILAAARIAAGSITADKLASKSITVGQISDAAIKGINDLITIGARNLLRNSGTPTTNATYGTRVFSTSSLKPNTKYTFVVNGFTSSASQKIGLWFNGGSSGGFFVNPTTTAKTQYVVVTTPASLTTTNVSIYNYPSGSTSCTINWACLYEGEIKPPMDWTPAPEDDTAAIATNSIANWCYNNNLTYINGGKIYTGTVAATQIAANAVVAGKIAANAVTAGTIVAGAITLDKLAANSVNASKIVAGSITAAQIAASTITGAKIAATTIAAGNLAANSVTSDKIVAGAITAGKIAAGAVTANELAANCITATNGKIASIDASKITTGYLDANRIRAGSITVTLLGNDVTGSIDTANHNAVSAQDAAKEAGERAEEAAIVANNNKSQLKGWEYENKTTINGGAIQAKTIDAEKLNVQSLSALSANLGTVTAGTIQSSDGNLILNLNSGDGLRIKNSKKATELIADGDGTRVVDTGGNKIAEFTSYGTETKQIKVSGKSELSGLLFEKVGTEIWVSKIA